MMAAMDRMDSQEIEEDELSDLETAIDNVTDRLSIFLDKLNPLDPIMLSPEEESKDFDLKLTNPESPVKAMEFELQMKSLVETVHINCEQTLQDSSTESFSAPIQMPETPPDTPITSPKYTSPTFSEHEDAVKEEGDETMLFSCNTFVFGPKGHFRAQTTAKDNTPLAKKVVEVMTAVTEKLSEMGDSTGFELVNDEYMMTNDDNPQDVMEVDISREHTQPPISRQTSDVSHDLEDLAKECGVDHSSGSSDTESERELSPEYLTPVLILPTPPPGQPEDEDDSDLTPRSDETTTSDASYSESYSECDSCKNASRAVHVDLLLPSTIDEDESRSELLSDMDTDPALLGAESLSDEDLAEEVDIPMMEVVEVEMVNTAPEEHKSMPNIPDEHIKSVPNVVLETPSFEDDAVVSIDHDIPSIEQDPPVRGRLVLEPRESVVSEPSIDIDNVDSPTLSVDKLYFDEPEVQIQLTEPSIVLEDQNEVNGYSELSTDSGSETSPRPKLERVETIEAQESFSSSSSDNEGEVNSEVEMTIPVLSEAELDILRAEVVLGTPVEPTPSPELPDDSMVVRFPTHLENGKDGKYEEEEGYLDDGRRFSEVLRIPDDEFTPSKEIILEEKEMEKRGEEIKLTDVPSTLDIDPISLEDSLELVTPATPALKAEIDARLMTRHDDVTSSDDSLTDDEEDLSPEFKSILDQMTGSPAEENHSLKKSQSSCSDSSRSTVENINDVEEGVRNSVPLEMSNDLVEPDEVEVKTPVPDDTPQRVTHTDSNATESGSDFENGGPPKSSKQLDNIIILDDSNISMSSPNTTLNTTAANISLNSTLARENKLQVKSKIPAKDPKVGKSFYLAFKLKMEGFNLKAKDVEKNAHVELWREGIKLSIEPKLKKGYFLYKIKNCSLRDSGMYIFKAKMLDYSIECGEDINVIEKGAKRSRSMGSLGSLGSILSLNKSRNNNS